jgi:hypothetical protein
MNSSTELPRGEEERGVPRRDRGDDADRLVARVIEHVGLVAGDDMPFDLVRQSAIVVIPLRHVGGLRAHLGQQLAVVAHLDLGEELRLLGDEVAELAQQRAALRGVHLRPLAAGECLVRGLDRAIRIFLSALGDQRPRLAGERIVTGKSFSGGGLDPFAADEHLVFGEGADRGVHMVSSNLLSDW